MNFIGIDLHTNQFTCCYRTERASVKERWPGRTGRSSTLRPHMPGRAQFSDLRSAENAKGACHRSQWLRLLGELGNREKD